MTLSAHHLFFSPLCYSCSITGHRGAGGDRPFQLYSTILMFLLFWSTSSEHDHFWDVVFAKEEDTNTWTLRSWFYMWRMRWWSSFFHLCLGSIRYSEDLHNVSHIDWNNVLQWVRIWAYFELSSVEFFKSEALSLHWHRHVAIDNFQYLLNAFWDVFIL